jgi:hypothetical protein
MPNHEHVAMLGRTAWNEWRANRDETPDLSRAGLRGLGVTRNWQSAFRDDAVACGAPIPRSNDDQRQSGIALVRLSFTYAIRPLTARTHRSCCRRLFHSNGSRCAI